jgi:putative transposase
VPAITVRRLSASVYVGRAQLSALTIAELVELPVSAAEHFPDARWQRCVVHFYCNFFSHVPRPTMREVAAMLTAIQASEDVHAAREKALPVVTKLRAMRLNKAAQLVETGVGESLAYYQFPEVLWQEVRTNNPLERILREIRRRSRVVGAFPNGQSAVNLATARLRHIAGSTWSTKRYLSMELLKDQQMSWDRGRYSLECAKDSGHYPSDTS